MEADRSRKRVLTIGEVVWDVFSDREVLGGAPLNVAYNLTTLGLDVNLISRIGDDLPGRRTLDELKKLHVSARGVQQDPDYPTGRVTVTVSNNEPSFEIVAPAAWDAIAIEPARKIAGESPFVLVFGTLAQRSATSRETIRALWKLADFRCYDVNLRPPFTTQDLVHDSLAVAEVVKVNREELKILGAWFKTEAEDARESAAALRAKFTINTLVVTSGSDGSWVLCEQGFFSHPGFPVAVVDTVGAGDDFFAAIIACRLAGMEWPDILARANRRGAFVASRSGATPDMRECEGQKSLF